MGERGAVRHHRARQRDPHGERSGLLEIFGARVFAPAAFPRPEQTAVAAFLWLRFPGPFEEVLVGLGARQAWHARHNIMRHHDARGA